MPVSHMQLLSTPAHRALNALVIQVQATDRAYSVIAVVQYFSHPTEQISFTRGQKLAIFPTHYLFVALR
jgi:hypothetical protein